MIPRTAIPVALILALALAPACRSGSDEVTRRGEPERRTEGAEQAPEPAEGAAEAAADEESRPPEEEVRTRFEARADERGEMVDADIAARGVRDPEVLAAMRAVPRHAFVPDRLDRLAYADRPLPIGHDQTISQPFIVAKMTELADLQAGDKVLEIGTGSGYQAAVLAEIADAVYTIEIVRPLGERARETLARLGYDDVHVRIGDGYQGWPEEAPFDAIVVTAAPPRIPAPLKEQLAVGGRLVIPVGDHRQELRVLTKTESGIEEHTVFGVRFVPMTGEAQE
ncbi:MAG: protein-L-isoaspartate(D-aspartate) O-methyltransferase [Myxococcota bacterium]